MTDNKTEIFNEIVKKSLDNKIDFLLATPPCQGMSVAGKMDENDPRNSLIIKAVEFIKIVKPKNVIIENVGGYVINGGSNHIFTSSQFYNNKGIWKQTQKIKNTLTIITNCIFTGTASNAITINSSGAQFNDFDSEEITKGGIVLPSKAQEKSQMAKIINVGPGKMIDGKIIPMNVSINQVVIINKYSGTEIKYENKEYVIISEKDILAIVE